MQEKTSLAFISPNALLLLCLALIIFFTPVLPVDYHDIAYHALFTSIFILSALSLQHVRRKRIIILALSLTAVFWIASIMNLPGLLLVSRIVQDIYFIYIVISLIRQTTSAGHVNLSVISDSISGYLLVGIIYSVVVYSFVRLRPDAFHFPAGEDNDERLMMSKLVYYTFVTYTSTGYGEIIPTAPGARSLATLISATGQLYVAIIIALLVGKFSSGTRRASE